MHIELITIGDELLDGRTRDLNIYYLGGRLRAIGATLSRVSMVDDDRPRLAQLLREAAQRADLIITSGGLGPTLDDLTREAIADATERPLALHTPSRDRLRAYFEARGREMSETNLRQAMMPEGAEVFASKYGTADAFETMIGTTPCLALPGVPFEFQGLVEEILVPRLRQEVPRIYRHLVAFGKGESSLAEIVEGLGIDPRVKITWKALQASLIIEFSVPRENAEVLDAALVRIEEALQPWVYASDNDSCSGAVAAILETQRLRIATAESCTGGLIASTLTDIPGASRWFNRGFITYGNDAKHEELAVPWETLNAHGAVSLEVASAMARGALERARANITVAVSGIAGPTGGSDEKPVGTVMIAVATPKATLAAHVYFPGRSRDDFKALVTELALVLVLRTLQARPNDLTAIPFIRSLTHSKVN